MVAERTGATNTGGIFSRTINIKDKQMRVRLMGVLRKHPKPLRKEPKRKRPKACALSRPLMFDTSLEVDQLLIELHDIKDEALTYIGGHDDTGAKTGTEYLIYERNLTPGILISYWRVHGEEVRS